MAKKVKVIIKLIIPGGKANPAPPIGPALGQHGVNIQDFCSKFNEKTKAMMGEVVPAEVTIYDDRSFTFILKTAPTSELIKKAAGIAKGSGKPLQEKVGKISLAQAKEIAEKKMTDFNTDDMDAAINMIKGTARQMGVEVK